MGERGTQRVLEYARLATAFAMGFANVRAGTRGYSNTLEHPLPLTLDSVEVFVVHRAAAVMTETSEVVITSDLEDA